MQKLMEPQPFHSQLPADTEICSCSWFREKPDAIGLVAGFVRNRTKWMSSLLLRFLMKPATPRLLASHVANNKRVAEAEFIRPI